FTEHERGPALIFDHPASAERLDFFLERRGESLDLDRRLALLRQVAETLKYAHSRRLFHQALTPQSILVTEPDAAAPEMPGIRIFNWQAGRREVTTSTDTRLTVEDIVRVGLAGEKQGAVYLAPELFSVGTLDAAKLDVFSLGTIAYHLLSGRHPAATVEERNEKLTRGGGLRLSEVLDGANENLEALIQMATVPEVGDRPEVADFVSLLDEVVAELAAPEPGAWVHPIDAGAGDELEGGFRVHKRLGKGGTAVALLAERDGREGVLKVALEPRLNERLRQEAEVLRRVRHQNVVQLFGEVELSGHAALFMATAGTENRAGTYTLAQRLREEGRLSLDLLQRFGDELLSALDWLEQHGISHRDIKPDNIGIGQTKHRKLTLLLFDFSLSGTPAENIRAGTPPYLDPFLVHRKPPRWDLYAERFAAAVTLYEMATGTPPTWGDGRSDPALLDAEATLEVEKLDAAVREALTRFFQKALARDYRRRFDNAEEMRRAWSRIFEQIDQPTTLTDPGEVDLEAALAAAGEETPVAALGLTPRVLNALERMGVHTLRELRDLPRIRLYRNKGIGQKTVREIRELAERVAEHFASPGAKPARAPDAGVAEEDPRVDPGLWSVDLIVRRLVPTPAVRDDAAVLRALLGLEETGPEESGPETQWPAQQEVAEAVGIPRAGVLEIVERARERWERQPWITALRADLARLLEKHGGVMTRAEVVQAVLTARGSAAPEAERERHAAAAAYAAIETESAREGARYVLHRGRDHLFLVATASLGEHFAAPPGARAAYAESLGARANELAQADPLLTPERAAEELAALPAPEGDRPLPPERILRLAVSASRGAALSSRMEIYPRAMAAARALKLGAGSLLGPRALTPEQIQQRIASRYPDAEPLPPPPRLDALLEEAGVHLRWDPARGSYTAPQPRPGYLDTSTTSSRQTTGSQGGQQTPETEEAWAVERRLLAAAAGRRFLALTVAPRHLLRAEAEILRRFPVERVNLESLLLREMRSVAEGLGARWEVVLRADAAGRESRDWRNLQRVVEKAIPALERALLARETPALLLYPGLLARYGQLALFETLRQACERGTAPGYLLLIPADGLSAMPVIDRVPLPVVHASEWARLPEAWVNNRHRAA
ncbi:MAG: BREX system serine/threonine kinase PglW, partial [Gemmatimonadetes bacterium]|nr:BREX system serine/threonine kinase PglW [Gemmatimonadota bacterium]